MRMVRSRWAHGSTLATPSKVIDGASPFPIGVEEMPPLDSGAVMGPRGRRERVGMQGDHLSLETHPGRTRFEVLLFMVQELPA
jgi:hypothetical protein